MQHSPTSPSSRGPTVKAAIGASKPVAPKAAPTKAATISRPAAPPPADELLSNLAPPKSAGPAPKAAARKPAAPPVVVSAAPVAIAARFVVDPRGASVALLATWPLRLFLAVTFFYAGVQKLTDPGFFRPKSITYIGSQIAAFAHHSPIGGFLTAVALPHAVLFGSLVAWGEIAIGLGAFFGLLFRPAAFFGALISATLWLSATWQIKPYFYGADIFSLFGWLTLLCVGTAGVLALDPILGGQLRPVLVRWLGVERAGRTLATLGLAPAAVAVPAAAVVAPVGRKTLRRARGQDRRAFLQGLAAGVGATIAGVIFWNALHPAPSGTFGALTGNGVAPGGSTTGGATTGAGATTAGATTAGNGSGTVIANLSSLPDNSSANFTIPSNQDPGIVVRLDSGNVVAFDATCTHAGCPVQYDPSSKYLLCPCHGAAFDPAQQAAVIQGPASYPLTPVAINVDQQSGAITLQ